jgi:hypothetical protein
VAQQLRELLDEHHDTPGAYSRVSPNHVLIPAAFDHGCPWGPPAPNAALAGGNPISLPTREDPAVPVTVIDSGYQWNDSGWPQNPLSSRLADPHPRGAELLPTLADAQAWIAKNGDTPGPWTEGAPSDVADNVWPAAADQSPEVVTVAEADGPHQALAALAGHANFVAGVVGLYARHADISIINHNGLYHPDSDDLPTEATVARSLIRAKGAAVINVGFAFAPFAPDPVNAAVSCIWQKALRHLGSRTVVVAPAGKMWHFERSCFSNDGEWAKCYAPGERVTAPFLHVNMELEDWGETQPPECASPVQTASTPQDFTATQSWAVWQGTSFAAPYAAAKICEEIATHGRAPGDAWDTVRQAGQVTTNAGETTLTKPILWL